MKCKYGLIDKKIQFSQTIQLSISMPLVLFNPLIWPLSVAITPAQSGPGSNGNKGLLCILQSSSITGTQPSDCLVSYLTLLQRCSRYILQPQPTGHVNWWDVFLYLQSLICNNTFYKELLTRDVLRYLLDFFPSWDFLFSCNVFSIFILSTVIFFFPSSLFILSFFSEYISYVRISLVKTFKEYNCTCDCRDIMTMIILII